MTKKKESGLKLPSKKDRFHKEDKKIALHKITERRSGIIVSNFWGV